MRLIFSSLLRILDLQINPLILKQQLVDSPFLNYCLNPGSARAILSSETEYGDLDCIYIFSMELVIVSAYISPNSHIDDITLFLQRALLKYTEEGSRLLNQH